jgi:hypothetical protein
MFGCELAYEFDAAFDIFLGQAGSCNISGGTGRLPFLGLVNLFHDTLEHSEDILRARSSAKVKFPHSPGGLVELSRRHTVTKELIDADEYDGVVDVGVHRGVEDL